MQEKWDTLTCSEINYFITVISIVEERILYMFD